MSAADKIAEARYLIVKQGLYYRPNAQGYTGIKDEAGRFSLEEARSYSHPNGAEGPRDGMSYVAEADAPDYSAACWDDTKAQHMAGKLSALADLADAQAQENARLREALDPNFTKADYIGEFKQRVCFGTDDDGDEIWQDVTISWDVTKQIMAAIRARAALGETP